MTGSSQTNDEFSDAALDDFLHGRASGSLASQIAEAADRDAALAARLRALDPWQPVVTSAFVDVLDAAPRHELQDRLNAAVAQAASTVSPPPAPSDVSPALVWCIAGLTAIALAFGAGMWIGSRSAPPAPEPMPISAPVGTPVIVPAAPPVQPTTPLDAAPETARNETPLEARPNAKVPEPPVVPEPSVAQAPPPPMQPEQVAASSPGRDVTPWVAAAAGYVRLMTAETLAGLPQTPEQLQRSLSDAGTRFGIDAKRVAEAAAGLRLQRVETLELNGRPLLQLAFLDGSTPIAVCILLRSIQPSAAPSGTSQQVFRAEDISGLNAMHWDVQPRGFLVIGRASAERIATLAKQIAADL